MNSELMKLGLEADGTVAVPPGDADSPAGWYENSPTPGELGSSIILGHVNSTQTGVGVFYRLHEMQDADQVSVTRADGTVAVFQVYRVDTYDKASFPAAQVYGNADRAELRLITCGGYDPSTGEFNQNTVAYAYLISSHPA
ncbi:sortase (surface protein transpeptidase) [Arthrobacter sp. CAN_C5]|nr:sortase (surface protein transpeptidase) [Arthrobacter sp. CAN_C5]